MEYCEAQQLNYITAVRFFKPIKNEVFHQKAWITLHDGIEITEWFLYTSLHLFFLNNSSISSKQRSTMAIYLPGKEHI